METDDTTATAPTELRTDDPRHRMARAVAIATQVIGAVGPDQLDLPTPCVGFDVRSLLSHMVGVLERLAVIGEGGNPMARPAMVEGVADDGWPAAWADAAHHVQAAFSDDAVLDRMVKLPWREAPAGEQMLGYVNEVTVHTWDLARATGQHPTWDQEVVEVAWTALHGSLPVAQRAELFAGIAASLPPGVPVPPPAFADAVTVPGDAPLIDRLVAWAGRQP